MGCWYLLHMRAEKSYKSLHQRLCFRLNLSIHVDEADVKSTKISCALVSIGFSITVKAVTLILISGRGSAISSAKQGNQVLFIIW